MVAPDLEGLGPDAATPYPYYSLSSLARSLIAGVMAARAAEPRLSDRWAAVGHSDGGHGALGVEALAGEAAGLTFVGTVPRRLMSRSKLTHRASERTAGRRRTKRRRTRV